MDFKRLNNMTGKDAVLNRRITSIFINDYENFLQIFSELPNTSDLTELNFLIHKNSPSFMIFELESILATYTAFVERKIKGEEITKDNTSTCRCSIIKTCCGDCSYNFFVDIGL